MEEGLFLPRVSLVITERCTLRCKLCAEYSPYFPKTSFASLDEVKRAIDILFQCVDSVGDLSISGGEPFLHKEIYRVIQYLEKYESRVNRILVLTNGTIVPSESELGNILNDVLREKLQLNISNYGEHLSTKIDQIEKMCIRCGIKHRVIKYYGKDLFCDGWIDYGDHKRKYFTEDDVREHAKKCYFRKTVNTLIHLMDGNIYLSRCGRSFWRKYIGVTSEKTSDIITFPKEITHESVFVLRNSISAIMNAAYSDSCAYCNGMCEDSPRFQPAEQITPEEIRSIQNELFGGWEDI